MSDERVTTHGVGRIGSVLVVGAVMTLAACGSSKYGAQPAAQAASSTTQAQSPTSPPPGRAPASPAVVMTASNATLGSVLVDGAGMTLYTLTNAGQPVACTGGCLKFWPPLLLPAGTTTASGSAGVTGLGTTAAAGGAQVTEAGAPLYRFSADMAPGNAKGDGIASFGGTWHVVKVAASAGETTGATTSPTNPPTTSGGGYHYP